MHRGLDLKLPLCSPGKKITPLEGPENPLLYLVKNSIWTHKITGTLTVSTVHDVTIACLTTLNSTLYYGESTQLLLGYPAVHVLLPDLIISPYITG